MSIAQSLPVEIVDQIIDQLQPDEKGKPHDGTVCGLVCRGWLPSSRYQTFARLSLSTRNIHSFIDVVQTSPYPILSCVRYLGLVFEGSDPILLQRLERLGPFPQVTRLRIYGLHHPPNLALFARLSRTSFGNVTTLDFLLCMLPLDSILPALSSFPSLERLGFRLSHFRSFEREGASETLESTFPRLRALYLNVQDPAGENFFKQILSIDPIPVVPSLSAKLSRPTENSFMEKYLCHLGSRLRYLQLDADHLPATNDAIGLRYSTNLQRLDLRVDPTFHFSLGALPILRCLRSRKLAAITLTNFTSLDVDEWRGWQELDEALTGAWFSNLRSLTIVVDNYNSADTSRVEECMPISSARGILRVAWRPPVVQRNVLDFEMEYESNCSYE